MNAYIAWTPLHIINIVNTMMNFFPNEKNDIYIYDEFENAEIIYQNLKKENIFSNVYYVSSENMGNILNKGFCLLTNRQNHIKHESIYDNIFIQGGNYFSKLLYAENKKKNSNLKLYYIEDGLGAYVGSPIIRVDTLGKKMMKVVNRYSMYNSEILNYFVYEPGLVKYEGRNDFFRLPKLLSDNPAYSPIKKIFGVDEELANTISRGILYFDQPFLDDGFSINEIESFNCLKKIVGDEDLLVKFHPRSKKNKYGAAVKELKTTLPWELLCLTTEISDLTLISIATTASFTPFLMLNRNIPVILLAEIYLEIAYREDWNEKTISMLKNVVDFTKEFVAETGATFYLPKTMNEAKALLVSKVESEEELCQ